jgi:hypothetical protein
MSGPGHTPSSTEPSSSGPGPVTKGAHHLRSGGSSFIPIGAHFVPVQGPDWPWRVDSSAFDRAFEQMSAAGMNAVRIDLLWAAIEPEAGRYDEDHLRELDEILASARRHGIWLHPALFIGGEVGDAYWDVPWRDGRHPHADPEMRRLQVEHAAMLARRWTRDPTIIAWDLTDEPPFWLFQDTSDEQARTWTSELVEAIRAEDPDHLITVGTAGQDVGWGPFRADVVATYLDFVCVHPYPIYQWELYPDALLSPRITHAAAFEVALASGAGKPAMVHEYGASSAQFDPERIAAYDRLLSWSSLGRGAIGYFAWCWTDAEPPAFRRAPYVRQPHETQFGVTDHLGELRPRGEVLSELAATVARLDLDGSASFGPSPPRAAIPVPHEFEIPYDQGAYGFSDEPAGPYMPSESIWSPRRGGTVDASPLVRSLLNAFVMAARADIAVGFPRESLSGGWPPVRLMILPAPLASTTITLWHVMASFWSGAEDFFEAGGVLYLSCSGDVAIPEMDTLAGCRLADRAPSNGEPILRFIRPWGPFRPEDELNLPKSDGSLGSAGVRLKLSDAEPIAVDGSGDPALVLARRGSGYVVTCAYPVEALIARAPDAHGPSDGSWGIYDGLADIAHARGPVVTGHPEVTVGTLVGPSGATTCLTNHGPDRVETRVRWLVDVSRAELVEPAGSRKLTIEDRSALVDLDAYGAAIVTWSA